MYISETKFTSKFGKFMSLAEVALVCLNFILSFIVLFTGYLVMANFWI